MLLSIVAGVWHMYERLTYDKLAYEADIYEYVSPQSKEVFHISRNHHFDELYTINNDFQFLIPAIKAHLSFPIIICTFTDRDPILLMKVGREQFCNIQNAVKENIVADFQPKKHEYKSSVINTYTLSNDRFLCMTNHNGILAFSNNHKVIQDFIDSDTQHTFFTSMLGREAVYKLMNNAAIGYFIPLHYRYLAVDYKAFANDSILMDGYILRDNTVNIFDDTIQSIDYQFASLDRYYIDTTIIDEFSVPSGIKIRFRKNRLGISR